MCEFAGFFDETELHQNADNSFLSDGDGDHRRVGAAGPTTGYAPVNGLKMYYEVHGRGEPVVLLHGAFMTITSNWEGWIGELSKTRKVIAVEMQGHGRTADIPRELSSENNADDVAALLKYLKLSRADLIGYSMGGGVAMQVAVRHPDQVRRVVVISSTFRRDGMVQSTTAPMFFIHGDADGIRLQHVAEMFRLNLRAGHLWQSATGTSGLRLGVEKVVHHVWQPRPRRLAPGPKRRYSAARGPSGANSPPELAYAARVEILRRYIDRASVVQKGWFAAINDVEVGRALRIMHAEPARKWTVDEIAAEVGVSRSALAQRFTDLVGESPMR